MYGFYRCAPTVRLAADICDSAASIGPCARAYVDHADVNGVPHGQTNAAADIDGGKMDGFVTQLSGADPNNPACTNSAAPDVMGYQTAGDIPNYWSYASTFVMQDHIFEPTRSTTAPGRVSPPMGGPGEDEDDDVLPAAAPPRAV